MVSNIFLFLPLLGEMISNLTNIFQMGWNHQVAIFSIKMAFSNVTGNLYVQGVYKLPRSNYRLISGGFSCNHIFLDVFRNHKTLVPTAPFYYLPKSKRWSHMLSGCGTELELEKTWPKWVNWKSLRLTFGDYYLIPSRKNKVYTFFSMVLWLCKLYQWRL